MKQLASSIDLIFINQPNLVIDSGVHGSLHSNCYYEIVYCKLNLNFIFTPPYQCFVWDHNKGDIDTIKKSPEQLNWENMLYQKYVHQQVSVLNKTLVNIFPKFMPNKLIACDDRDPPWINEFIKNKIKWKNKIYKDYTINKN